MVVISAVPSPFFPDKIPWFPKPAPLIEVLNKVEQLVSGGGR